MCMKAPNGKVVHCEMKIGDSTFMLGDEGMGFTKSPQTLGGTCCTFFCYFPDVDASFDRAIQAGCAAKMPVADMFWGDRYGVVADPFGCLWGLATHKEDVKPEEMEKRAKDFFAKMEAA